MEDTIKKLLESLGISNLGSKYSGSQQNSYTQNERKSNKANTQKTIEEDLVFDPLTGEFKHKSSSPPKTSIKKKYSLEGECNGHGYVDLGLPSGLKWAICNLGASWPGEYGEHFAWGECKPKSVYNPENCPTFQKDNIWLQENGYLGKDGNLAMAHDPARQNWGDPWRLPTLAELQELVQYTTTQWTTYNGVKGRLIVSKINRKSIFIPAAGWIDGHQRFKEGVRGYCWGSTPNTKNLWRAAYICFFSDGFEANWSDRFLGRSVRPVFK